MKKVLAVCISAVLLVSCGQNTKEVQRLQAENDSLKIENTRNNTEMDEMLSLLNDIETDFQSIRDAENYLTLQQNAELTPSKREQIRQNMQLIKTTLDKNKEKINELEAKLNKSNVQSAALRKTIDRLTAEVNQKATMIMVLQEELAQKNVRIQELDAMVSSLNEDVEDLAASTAAQAEIMKQKDTELNTAYYCFGTSKELKGQKIISKSGLFSKTQVLKDSFNKDYFMKIDIRETKEIPLFAGKAKLRSNHPAGSYEMAKDQEGNITFKITDVKLFWSLGRFLVIEVN